MQIFYIMLILLRSLFKAQKDPVIYIKKALNELVEGSYHHIPHPKVLHFKNGFGLRINPAKVDHMRNLFERFERCITEYSPQQIFNALHPKTQTIKKEISQNILQKHVETISLENPNSVRGHPTIILKSGFGITTFTQITPDMPKPVHIGTNAYGKPIYAVPTIIMDTKAPNVYDEAIHSMPNMQALNCIHKTFENIENKTAVIKTTGMQSKIEYIKRSEFQKATQHPIPWLGLSWFVMDR